MSEPEEGPRQPPPPREPEPYGSIVERFRGTEWDPARDRPAPPPPPPAQIGRTLVVVGVMALIVAGALGAFGALSQRPAATEPSRFIATPQPTPGPDDLLLAAFWTTVETPGLSFHVESTGSATAGSEKGSLSTSLDVRSEDFTGTFSTKVKGDPYSGRWFVVRSAGVVYLSRDGKTGWRSGTANQIELRMSPFLGLVDHRQLRYGSAITEGASTLYRLVSTDLYRPGVGRVLPIVQVAMPTAAFSLEVIVTAAGMPVRATLTAHAPADPATGAPALDVRATYAFTRFGEIAPISPPKL